MLVPVFILTCSPTNSGCYAIPRFSPAKGRYQPIAADILLILPVTIYPTYNST